jgi:leucyl/phenylalanyl-tRNA--protein transferase
MPAIVLLDPDDPLGAFPDPSTAATEPNGLLAAGGDLAPERLLAAYRQGIFPWYEVGQPILWWPPDPRAVLLPSRLHVSRSLQRLLRRDRYRVSVDQAFDLVIDGCANARLTSGTWITPEMHSAYADLHRLGHAHAIETWDGPELVGGLYGISLGGVFFGESMFSRAPDASKVALVKLVHMAERRGIKLIDCQVETRHLCSLGSELMPRAEFVSLIGKLTLSAARTDPWPEPPGATSQLAPRPDNSARLHD